MKTSKEAAARGVTPLADAIDVARYFILLGEAEEEPEALSPMRLQKLLYYAQGWSLVERDEPMFADKIEAWAHGPVVPDVFHSFKRYGSKPIDPTEGSADNLSEEQQEFISRVWDAYKGFSALRLSDMTHREAPWRDARAGLPREANSNREIKLGDLRRFFEKQARAR